MPEIPVEQKCHDFGERPGCLGTIDPQYTMRFDDLGEDPIHWCAYCGPQAQQLDKALTEFLMKSPENREQLKTLLDAAECTHKSSRN